MGKSEKFIALATQMKKSGMDNRSGLLEALAIAHNEDVQRRVENLVTSFSTSIKSLLDLPKKIDADIYDVLMKKVSGIDKEADDVIYQAEDGSETKKPNDLGITDPTNSPDSVEMNGKKYKKMKPTTPGSTSNVAPVAPVASSDSKVVVVDWDFTDEEHPNRKSVRGVPKEVEVPGFLSEEEISDWLSDEYGWLVSDWRWK